MLDENIFDIELDGECRFKRVSSKRDPWLTLLRPRARVTAAADPHVIEVWVMDEAGKYIHVRPIIRCVEVVVTDCID